MNTDDQAFLDQIEQNIRGKDNEQDVARREAEQRALEMERIRKASANLPKPGAPKASPAAVEKKNPLEDDPRYKEYFERLKRQKGISTPTPPGGNAASGPAPAPSPSAQPGSTVRSDSQVVGPGAIVRFDDGSIGIYKDAVSGRDYALFYFLQPDGQFIPKGVFLQSYQAKVIGNLPENYFAEQREASTWNRDLILYHLSKFEHNEFLNSVSEHEERKPKNATPAKPAAVSQPVAPQPSVSQPAAEEAPNPKQAEQPTPKPAPASAPANPLVKGRKFQIVFGGKKWEAVYWTSDENGAIVAHSTHGHWSLMRLDLDRFKDSLELGDIVDSDLMDQIATDAAGSK